MKWIWLILIFLIQLNGQTNQSREPVEMKVLLFTKAMDYIHESIAGGSAAIMELGRKNGFQVDSTSDAALINEENLSRYAAVVFYNTSGAILDEKQKAALQAFIRCGKGFAGIHGASATEYDWPWYGNLVGAFFDAHPKIQTATLKVIDKTHPSTAHLPDQWVHEDEWYNFRSPDWSKLKVLMVVDESTYSGGKHGSYHPISWYHDFEGGRAWYTAIGHRAEYFKNSLFAKHILGGILYAAGAE